MDQLSGSCGPEKAVICSTRKLGSIFFKIGSCHGLTEAEVGRLKVIFVLRRAYPLQSTTKVIAATI
jgi:hypothetical protein